MRDYDDLTTGRYNLLRRFKETWSGCWMSMMRMENDTVNVFK